MGCLNSTKSFKHWFGNIHLSGPCNRSCYFCIGQHMMSIDPLNTLGAWPLPGMDAFLSACRSRGVREINLTGSNTDPLLYRHHSRLCGLLRREIPGVEIGIRTNGALAVGMSAHWSLYDKASVSVTSLAPDIYRKTMGQGEPPDIPRIVAIKPSMPIKVNVVLCPETVDSGDLFKTLDRLAAMGVGDVNLREPYGQPHIGDPLAAAGHHPSRLVYGMPQYECDGMRVMYWDVHYCHVESVNLYANGVVSEDYPVTRGHDAERGRVDDQGKFHNSGRVRPQWVGLTASV